MYKIQCSRCRALHSGTVHVLVSREGLPKVDENTVCVCSNCGLVGTLITSILGTILRAVDTSGFSEADRKFLENIEAARAAAYRDKNKGRN